MSQAPKVVKAKPICGRRRTTVIATDQPSTSTQMITRRHSIVNPQLDKKHVRFLEETPQNQKRNKTCNETTTVTPPESNTVDEMSIIVRCAAERTEEIMTEYSETLISKVQSTLSDSCVVIQDSITKYKNLYKKQIEQIYLECESKINELKEAASTSNAETGSQNQPTTDSGDESLNDSNARENGAIPKNQYLVALPSDYRPNDPTWTLKHKKPIDNFVVDMDVNSGVYIDKARYKHHLQNSTSYTLLARGLLEEIFTKSALQVCTLEESKHSHRPGLEERALKALFKFVTKYGKQKGWANFDPKKIRVSLQGKLQMFRKKSETTILD